MNGKPIVVGIALSLGLMLTSCSDDPMTPGGDGGTDGGTGLVSLDMDVLPIVQMRCGGCHTRTDPPFPPAVANDVYFEQKEDILGLVGSFIIAGDSANSGFIAIFRQDMAVGMGPTLMPPPEAAPAVPASETDTIALWVDQGAMDN